MKKSFVTVIILLVLMYGFVLVANVFYPVHSQLISELCIYARALGVGLLVFLPTTLRTEKK